MRTAGCVNCSGSHWHFNSTSFFVLPRLITIASVLMDGPFVVLLTRNHKQ